MEGCHINFRYSKTNAFWVIPRTAQKWLSLPRLLENKWNLLSKPWLFEPKMVKRSVSVHRSVHSNTWKYLQNTDNTKDKIKCIRILKKFKVLGIYLGKLTPLKFWLVCLFVCNMVLEATNPELIIYSGPHGKTLTNK